MQHNYIQTKWPGNNAGKPHTHGFMGNRIGKAVLMVLLIPGFLLAAAEGVQAEQNPERNAYFGDLHVHTRYSTDARIFGTVATPDDAYRFAKGDAIDLPALGRVQLKHGALDFMAVTDHAEYLGVLGGVEDPEKELGFAIDDPMEAYSKLRKANLARRPLSELDRPDLTDSAWQATINAAENHYQPGKFTTFTGFEWTLKGPLGTAHRNVIFRGRDVTDRPFSTFDSVRPEDLWSWLDTLRAQGKEAMAIPHNPNLSGGSMWEETKSGGEPIDLEWARQRLRNEVIVEMTQVKGTSEAHPLLSTDDEWSDFEIYAHKPPLKKRFNQLFESSESLNKKKIEGLKGSYVRAAYKRGLELGDSKGFNPYKFGMIGSTDTHNAASTFEEDNYYSKAGKMTATPQARLLASEVGFIERLVQIRDPKLWGSSGLAAVWAEENTRESIYDAFRRKETFATTGTRIRVRFFASFDFAKDLHQQADAIRQAYAHGVPMGGDLVARDNNSAPKFLVWALRDPDSAPLQRIQVIKGWMENGESREKVFDVVGSDGLVPDPLTHRIPDNGASVNLKTGQWDEDKGAVELRAVWIDPEFDPEQHSFYYLRVLENPTLRWSTYDANTLGIEPLEELPATIQERAYTSPIWYSPLQTQ